MINLVRRGHWLRGVSRHVDDHAISKILESYSEKMVERGMQEKSRQKSPFDETRTSGV